MYHMLAEPKMLLHGGAAFGPVLSARRMVPSGA